MMKVLGISGSLRERSYNRLLLKAAALEMPDGVELTMYQGLAQIPPFDEDAEAPAVVRALRQAIAGADAVLVSTPEYNNSIPGQLKNALDWVSRPFPNNALRSKPVAVMGASTGLFGAVWAQAEMRKVLGKIGAWVIDEELPVGQAHEAFLPDGRLKDGDQRAALSHLINQLLNTAHAVEERSA